MDATMDAGTVPVVNNPLTWIIKNPNPNIGQVLVIQLPHTYNTGSSLSIQIFYNTQVGGNSGVNFLNPSQTSGGVEPMMYTYSMEIFGRMVAPQ